MLENIAKYMCLTRGDRRILRSCAWCVGLVLSVVLLTSIFRKRWDKEITEKQSKDFRKSVCNETFNKTFEENLAVIKNYPQGIADAYMWKLGGKLKRPVKLREFPVVVTALSRRYYPQSMGFFKSVHKYFTNNSRYADQAKLVVYDLGLSERQVKMLKRHCLCELRQFPFEEFPPHVRSLRTYAFKPIIIQLTLMEFGFVWWADTSIRFTRYFLDDVIQTAVNNSMLFSVNHDASLSFPITRQTDTRTFEYLHEDRCKFRNLSEASATTILLHFDDVTQAVVKTWTACALNVECIAPEGTDKKLICVLKQKQDGRCHRFDQSIFSILTRRLYHESNNHPLYNKIYDVLEVKRTIVEKYFESCNPIFICIA